MEKIRKINYVNEVYDQLNAMICCGEISEGMRIPSEMALAKEMNVSRPVVREALQRLRAEHKIITYQGTGSFCANPLNYENELDEGGDNITEDDFREFQEFRAAVEYGAVQQAAENRTEEDLRVIKSHLDGMLQMPPEDYSVETYSREDEAFHYAIYLATHNSMMIDAYTAVRPRIYRVLSYLNRHKGAVGISGDFHQLLFDYIVKKQPCQAARLIKSHDEYNRARVAEYQKMAVEKE